MRVVGYCRVGMKSDEQRNSFEIQKNNIEQISEQNNYELVEIYTDIGISGTTTIKARKELQRLLKDAESDKYDAILIKGIGKLSRKIEDLIDILEVFWKNNKKVYFISKNIKLKELNYLMCIGILSATQLESNDVRELIKEGMNYSLYI